METTMAVAGIGALLYALGTAAAATLVLAASFVAVGGAVASVWHEPEARLLRAVAARLVG